MVTLVGYEGDYGASSEVSSVGVLLNEGGCGGVWDTRAGVFRGWWEELVGFDEVGGWVLMGSDVSFLGSC